MTIHEDDGLRKKSAYFVGAFSLGTVIFLILNCSGGYNSNSGGNYSSAGYNWTQIGPQGGFISSVAFDPRLEGVVWASGDDSGGLYKSTDGGNSWNPIRNSILDSSTYSLRFDPTSSVKIFAPNHFGRGMLKSIDGGYTWVNSQASLPISGTSSQLLSDLQVSPMNPTNVFVATDSGLFKSTDGGNTFTPNNTSLSGNTVFRSLAFRSDGVLFAGKSDGVFGYSPDLGTTWTQVLAPNNISLDVIVISTNWIYLGYRNAAIFRIGSQNLSGGLINDPTQSTAIQSTNRLAIAVFPGALASSDTVYVGTSGSSSLSAGVYGLFKSADSGQTWTQTMNGMAGNYIASVAIDPLNVSNVVAGSNLGRGICHSTNGGTTWSCVTGNIYSTASLGLATDPGNSKHLLASNTACGGFSSNFETTNGGQNWTNFSDPVTHDGVFAFDIDPSNSANILAGTCTQGIYRSTTGTAGPYTNLVTTVNNRVDRFVRDKVTATSLYAIVPNGDSNHSVYFSSNSGVTFAPLAGIQAINIAVHPTHAGEGIITSSGDAFVSTTFFSSSSSLNMASIATAEGGLIAAAYNPAILGEVLVGGANGGLYKTQNYVSTGVGVTWTKLNSPVKAAAIRDIVIVNRNQRYVYYVATSCGDTGVNATSTPGVFRSVNGGQTWTLLSLGLFPGNMIWRFIPSVNSPTNTFLAGMWAGGLFQLSDSF